MGLDFVGYLADAPDGRLRFHLVEDPESCVDVAPEDVTEATLVEGDSEENFECWQVTLADDADVERSHVDLGDLERLVEEPAVDERLGPMRAATRGRVCGGVLTRHPLCVLTPSVCVPVSQRLCPTAGPANCEPAPPTPQCRTAPCPRTAGGGPCDPASRHGPCPV